MAEKAAWEAERSEGPETFARIRRDRLARQLRELEGDFRRGARAREESDEEGDDGRTGRWLPRMGRRWTKASPVKGERGRRKEEANLARAVATKQRRQAQAGEARQSQNGPG